MKQFKFLIFVFTLTALPLQASDQVERVARDDLLVMNDLLTARTVETVLNAYSILVLGTLPPGEPNLRSAMLASSAGFLFNLGSLVYEVVSDESGVPVSSWLSCITKNIFRLASPIGIGVSYFKFGLDVKNGTHLAIRLASTVANVCALAHDYILIRSSLAEADIQVAKDKEQ